MKVKELLQILNNFIDNDPSAMEYEINMNNEQEGETYNKDADNPIVDIVIFPGFKHVTLYEY